MTLPRPQFNLDQRVQSNEPLPRSPDARKRPRRVSVRRRTPSQHRSISHRDLSASLQRHSRQPDFDDNGIRGQECRQCNRGEERPEHGDDQTPSQMPIEDFFHSLSFSQAFDTWQFNERRRRVLICHHFDISARATSLSFCDRLIEFAAGVTRAVNQPSQPSASASLWHYDLARSLQ